MRGRRTRVLRSAVLAVVAVFAAVACTPADDGTVTATGTSTPAFNFQPVPCSATGLQPGLGGPYAGAIDAFDCGESSTLSCIQQTGGQMLLLGPGVVGLQEWPDQGTSGSVRPVRFYAATQPNGTGEVPDTSPDKEYGESPGGDAYEGAATALGLLQGATFIEVDTAGAIRQYSCEPPTDHLNVSGAAGNVFTYQEPLQWVCFRHGLIAFDGIPIYSHTDALGWCDKYGTTISSPNPLPGPPVLPWSGGNVDAGYYGEAVVCNPSGVTATSLGTSAHWPVGSPVGAWFNVEPDAADSSQMFAFIGGVPAAVPRVALCKALGDGGTTVPYGYSGRGYVCNDTGTVTIAFGGQTFSYGREDPITTYHDIRPWITDPSQPASTTQVQFWTSGLPMVANRADICAS